MAVRSLNKAMIIGNLTRDPEMKYTASGTALTTFGVATNRAYSPSNSEEVFEDTEFHNVVAWAKLAELCNQLLRKGQKVYISGRLQTRKWEDEATGKTMYRTEIVAEDMIVLSPPSNSQRTGGVSTKAAEESVIGGSGSKEVESSGGGDTSTKDVVAEDKGEDIPF